MSGAGARGALGGAPVRRRPAPPVSLPRPVCGSAALSALAAAVLAACAIAALRLAAASEPAASPPRPGTAYLGTATCADWLGAGPGRRAAIVAALATATTAPDPENRGATLARGQAYLVFDRACANRVSRSFLLYEIYNRAASFGAAGAAGGFSSGALSH